MIRRPTRSTRTDTLFPYTTLFRSHIRSGRRAALRDVHPTGLAGPITATTATPVHDPRAIGRGAAKKRRMLWIRGYGPINGRQSLGRSIAIEKAVLPRHPLQLPETETNHGGPGKGHAQRYNARKPATQAQKHH